MNRFLYAVFAFGLIAIMIVYGWPFLRPDNVDQLIETALHGPSPAEQVAAARELSQCGERARDGMRKTMAQSDNDDVVSMSIAGLTRLADYESLDQIIAKLDDGSEAVRSAAAKATVKLLGRDHHYPIRGTAEQRNRVKNQIARDWEEYNGSELFQFNKQRLNDQSESAGLQDE